MATPAGEVYSDAGSTGGAVGLLTAPTAGAGAGRAGGWRGAFPTRIPCGFLATHVGQTGTDSHEGTRRAGGDGLPVCAQGLLPDRGRRARAGSPGTVLISTQTVLLPEKPASPARPRETGPPLDPKAAGRPESVFRTPATVFRPAQMTPERGASGIKALTQGANLGNTLSSWKSVRGFPSISSVGCGGRMGKCEVSSTQVRKETELGGERV